ncbi:MAG TPA: SAV_2336 N-terminal domain-related protein, partial [Rhizobacter sp.]|nr:SAV_2336 N-terminal domain-related protein [Rhizobacter sp.]
RALAGRLALMRALRPLGHRWPSRQYAELDEEATVDATAQLRAVLPQVMYPVFRPRRERWYDLELVLEDDAAIELWADSLREFAQALRETGAFRLVRSWRLRMPARSAQHGRPLLENAAGALMPCAHLVGHGVRRQVMFATHGSSARWLDGSYAETIRPWAQDDSVVLLQLMPPERWAQTRLGEPHGFASAGHAGASAASLKVHTLWWQTGFEPEAKGLLPVPTVSLQPVALNEWARMQMARGRQCPVYLLDPTRKPAAADATPHLSTTHDFERAIGQLRRVSPPAFQLAVSLCTSVFTIPVARLVQAAKFDGSAHQGADPGADQSVLAELLQSGLVRARQPAAGEVSQFASTQYYEFRPEAQQLLLRSLRDADARQIAHEIRAQVSRYLQQISGSAVSTSQLVPDAQGSYDLPEWAQPFAEVASSLLGPPPDVRTAQAVFEAFERSQAPSIVGAVARLAASGRALEPAAIEPVLWQHLLSAQLIQQDAQGRWLFEPHIAALLKQLDERQPLLGARILWVDDKPENNQREGAQLKDWG